MKAPAARLRVQGAAEAASAAIAPTATKVEAPDCGKSATASLAAGVEVSPGGGRWSRKAPPRSQQPSPLEGGSSDRQQTGSDDVEEDSWVMVEDMPLGISENEPSVAGEGSQACAAALAGGAAGLLLLGSLSGAALAAGVAYTVLGDPISAGPALEANSVREWAENLRLPERLASAGHSTLHSVGSGELLRQFSDTAQAALASGRARRALSEAAHAAEVLGHGLRTVCPALADSALEERERAIAGLAQELEVVERAGLKERGDFTQKLEATQREAKEARERLSAELEASERERAMEIARLEIELEGARHAKERDCDRLMRELELAKHAGEDESDRLRRELREVERTREEELDRLAEALQSTERRRDEEACRLEQEVEEGRQLSSELESMRRVREESTCCICMEAPRQVLFLPCRHVCCCEGCSHQLERCPVDRISIAEQIRFTMA